MGLPGKREEKEELHPPYKTVNVLQDIWHNILVRVLQSYTGNTGKIVMLLKKAKGGYAND